MDIGNFAQVCSALVSVTALVVSLIFARNKGTKDALDSLRTLTEGKASRRDTEDLFDRMHKAESKLAAFENELEHLPNKETTHRLETTMARLEGELRVMAESLKPVARISERLQEFLLEQVKQR